MDYQGRRGQKQRDQLGSQLNNPGKRQWDLDESGGDGNGEKGVENKQLNCLILE